MMSKVAARRKTLERLERITVLLGLTLISLAWLVPQYLTSYYVWQRGTWQPLYSIRQRDLVTNIDHGQITKVSRWNDEYLARLSARGVRAADSYYVERRIQIDWLTSLLSTVVIAGIAGGSMWAVQARPTTKRGA